MYHQIIFAILTRNTFAILTRSILTIFTRAIFAIFTRAIFAILTFLQEPYLPFLQEPYLADQQSAKEGRSAECLREFTEGGPSGWIENTLRAVLVALQQIHQRCTQEAIHYTVMETPSPQINRNWPYRYLNWPHRYRNWSCNGTATVTPPPAKVKVTDNFYKNLMVEVNSVSQCGKCEKQSVEKFACNVQSDSVWHARLPVGGWNTTHYINPYDTHMDQNVSLIAWLKPQGMKLGPFDVSNPPQCP